MSKRFKKYPSIENSYREKFIDTIRMIVPSSEKWITLEKIHGASIQLYYDDKGFNYGKRNSFINGSFFNSHNILPKYEENIKAIWEEVNKNRKIKDLPIRIFGEIFGGKYNGKYSRIKSVQKEVEYCQEIDAIFFDLMIGDDFIPYCRAMKTFEEYDIPYIKPLAILPLDLALQYQNDFDSKIGQDYYNLPIIKGNTCEGTVIKPYENEYKTHRGSRVIIKNKNEKFTEKRRVKKVSKLAPFSDKANELIADLESYITENRFNAVFSKDEYTKKDFGMFLGDFVKDLREDAKKDNVAFESIDVNETRRVNKLINKKAVMFIKKLFFSKVEF